jgi:hypothetical protein
LRTNPERKIGRRKINTGSAPKGILNHTENTVHRNTTRALRLAPRTVER